MWEGKLFRGAGWYKWTCSKEASGLSGRLLVRSHVKMNNFSGPPLLYIQWKPSQVIITGLLASRNFVLNTPCSHTAGAAVVTPDAKAFSSKTLRSLCWLSKDWYIGYFTRRTEANDEWDQRCICPITNPLFVRAQTASADSERNLIPCNWEGNGFVSLRKDCIIVREEVDIGDLAEIRCWNGTGEL